ncbi:MAG: Fe-S cluster assembly protein IscX [Alphaproteobacteria bacterium]|nr:Fe-S cluster assembly protein IscX [Alphaproteobacteria bacterium]
MQWTDIYAIAIALDERYGDADILSLRFTELRRYIMGLSDFIGNPEHCNERILEAIQMAWLSERD